MGAGKSCIGRKLAQRLRWKFLDSDAEIEKKTGVNIPTIFEIEGENGFRSRESQILSDLVGIPNIVLASGGGSVLLPENQELLRAHGFIIYLATSVQSQLVRTQRDRHRPLLCTKDRRAKLEELATQRNPIYERLANLTLSTDDRSINDTVKKIIAELKTRKVIS